ncbi:hypothetical protein BGX38DRAFT_1147599 [Terfezia claveryi]|nr:hypothetical protein BGX38DRAFT_1147599 [Terfezia claveryi]
MKNGKVKKLGNQDPMSISRIRSSFICLIFMILQHALPTYESGALQDREFFNYMNSSLKDLKKVEQTHLILCGYFKEGFLTLPDILVYSCSPANNRYDGLIKEVKDVQSASGDSKDAGSKPGKDGDEEAEDKCEDSEDNNKSDTYLQDDDNNDCEAEDGIPRIGCWKWMMQSQKE